MTAAAAVGGWSACVCHYGCSLPLVRHSNLSCNLTANARGHSTGRVLPRKEGC